MKLKKNAHEYDFFIVQVVPGIRSAQMSQCSENRKKRMQGYQFLTPELFQFFNSL